MKKVFTRDKEFYQKLVVLSIPVALQNLITFLVGFADNLMVSPLGDSVVSGVYMGGQVQTFLQVFTAGIEGTILLLASQYWGRGDKGSVKKIISIGIHFSLGVGLVLMGLCALLPRGIIGIFTNEPAVVSSGTDYIKVVCFSYPFFCVTQALIASMRSVETPLIGMLVSVCSLGINVFLNFGLIQGRMGFPAMGIRGAAVATLVSRMAETTIMAIYVLRVDKKLQLKIKDFFVTDKTLRRDFVRYGLPLVGGQVVWAVNLMGNSIILGHFDQTVITGASVANTMNTLGYVTMNGMSNAVGIITGKAVGAGQTEKVKEYARTVQVLFFALGLLTGGTIALLKKPFVSLYGGISAGAAAHALRFMTVLSVSFIGTCYQAACLFGLVKSGGDVNFVFKNDAVFVLGVVLPSAILASFLGAPAWVVYACLKCDQILKCFVAVVKINRFDWMKNLTRESEGSV